MNRFFATGRVLLCLTLLGAGGAWAADAAQPAPELLQYIRDARKLGFKDVDIKAHAVKGGWKEAQVDEALRALTSAPASKQPPAARPARAQEAPAKPAAQPPAKPAVQPPAQPPARPAAQPAGRAAQPSPDLIQYVKDARGLGLPDSEIKANAIQAGWSQGMVEQAVHPASSNAGPGGSDASSAAGSPAEARHHGVPDDYQIGAGDVLEIRVWKEPDASVAAVVRPDGKITVPLLKEVMVVGLTPTEVERIVSSRLSEFIQAANVTVVVTGINSKKIYLVGAVRKEGPIPLSYRMSVLQALSEAGGLTEYAKRKNIYVLRTQGGKQYRFPFNYDAVIRGEQMEQNIWVAPDDTIVVPH